MPVLCSVITPAYNASRFIQQTIESVQAQTYQDWEMIVVDDCSTDDTCDVVEEKRKTDGRIKLIRLDKNAGQANARNAGLSVARGRYVAFLDSDDMWLPDKLAHQVEFMQAGDIAFSFTYYRQVTEDGKREGGIIKAPPVIDYKTLLERGNFIGCLTVLVDKEKVVPVSLPRIAREDYALWLAILKKGFKAFCLQEDLARYRVALNSHSRNKVWAARKTWAIYRKHEKLPLLYACRCFAGYAWEAYKRNRGFIDLVPKTKRGRNRS